MNSKKLDEARQIFLGLGFVVSKFKYLPIAFLASFALPFSLYLSLLGYFFWFLASQYYSYAINTVLGSKMRRDQKGAALFGIFAVLLCIGSEIFPLGALYSYWFLGLSNLFWARSEYYKKESFLKNKDPATAQQEAYFEQTLALCFLSCLTAFSNTLTFMFPLFIPLIDVGFTLSAVVLGAIILERWIRYTFPIDPPVKEKNLQLKKGGEIEMVALASSKKGREKKVEKRLVPEHQGPLNKFKEGLLPSCSFFRSACAKEVPSVKSCRMNN